MFIQQSDFKNKINLEILQQILGEDETEAQEKLTDAEADAAAIVTDHLSKNYQLENEWLKLGSDRNRRLLKWMLNLMAYYLYEGIPDDDVPERIIKDYDDTKKELAKASDGKINLSFQRIIKESTQRPKTKLRWGSNTKRQHNW